ncbi:hypothetical protein [Mucilaginibacter sp.]
MKKINNHLLLILSIVFMSLEGNAQTMNKTYNIKDVIGRYQSKDGLQFVIKNDSSFYILKRHNKAFDAVSPSCDTMAKGTWHPFSGFALKLSNDKSFGSILSNVSQETKGSKDSIYIKIDLPKDDAFASGRFKYQITVAGKIDFLESISATIALEKKKLFESGDLYYNLGLTIQDLSPLNCKLNGKCYQRIYFNVFEDYKLNTTSNYFTIKLPQFNDCFVERADVDNQLLVIDKNKVHWQDVDFLKVK